MHLNIWSINRRGTASNFIIFGCQVSLCDEQGLLNCLSKALGHSFTGCVSCSLCILCKKCDIKRRGWWGCGMALSWWKSSMLLKQDCKLHITGDEIYFWYFSWEYYKNCLFYCMSKIPGISLSELKQKQNFLLTNSPSSFFGSQLIPPLRKEKLRILPANWVVVW